MVICKMYCIPIIAENNHEAIKKISYASDLADVLELRLDLMKEYDLKELIQTTQKPVLVTYRSKEEGGGGNSDPNYISKVLSEAVDVGSNYIEANEALSKMFEAFENSNFVFVSNFVIRISDLYLPQKHEIKFQVPKH